jgi:hypothetical protein
MQMVVSIFFHKPTAGKFPSPFTNQCKSTRWFARRKAWFAQESNTRWNNNASHVTRPGCAFFNLGMGSVEGKIWRVIVMMTAGGREMTTGSYSLCNHRSFRLGSSRKDMISWGGAQLCQRFHSNLWTWNRIIWFRGICSVWLRSRLTEHFDDVDLVCKRRWKLACFWFVKGDAHDHRYHESLKCSVSLLLVQFV